MKSKYRVRTKNEQMLHTHNLFNRQTMKNMDEGTGNMI